MVSHILAFWSKKTSYGNGNIWLSTQARLWASKQAAIRPLDASLTSGSEGKYSEDSDSARVGSNTSIEDVGYADGSITQEASRAGTDTSHTGHDREESEGKRDSSSDAVAGGPTLEQSASLPPSSTAQVSFCSPVLGAVRK